jgi:hypothetical protein
MSGPAALTTAPLHPEALEQNRQGRLTDAQRKAWTGRAGILGGDLRMFALFFAIVGAVLLLAPGQVSLPGPIRIVAGVGCLVAAAYVAYLSLGGSSMSRDARAGRVLTVEGPVTTDRVQAGGGGVALTHYYLLVAGGRYECSPQAVDLVGIGGVFRVYYLPRSRRVVNLERLADVPLPAGALEDPTAVLKQLPSALGIHGHERQAETMATLAAMQDALAAAATPPPEDQRDARPLAESIVGAWHGLMGSVRFGADGSAKGTLGGTQMAGRWSVGDDGKLHLDGMGEAMVVDARVSGDSLTLELDGMSLPFQRTAGA